MKNKIDFERIAMAVILGTILINTLALFWFVVALDESIESEIAWRGIFAIILTAIYFGRLKDVLKHERNQARRVRALIRQHWADLPTAKDHSRLRRTRKPLKSVK